MDENKSESNNQLASDGGGAGCSESTSALLTTYSLRANSHQTQIAEQGQENVLIDRLAPSNEFSPPPPQAEQPLTAQRVNSRTRRSTLHETLLDSLIKGGKSNGLLTCLLGATMLASILNTLLLSFVVKSIQLQDKGFINGRISWDERSNSTLLHLLARVVAGKSISVKAIESFSDKPLRLEMNRPLATYDGNPRLGTGDGVASPGEFATAAHDGQTPGGSTNDFAGRDDGGGGGGVLLSAGMPSSPPSAGRRPITRYVSTTIDDYLDPNFNYLNLATNGQYTDKSQRSQLRTSELGSLEIRTNSLVMDMIDGDESGRGQELSDGTGDHSGRQQVATSDTAVPYTNFGVRPRAGDERTRLVEFNGKVGSISLPMQNQLNLNSLQTSSLVVSQSLRCSHITGSLRDNLEIQTRDANLACRSGGDLRLQAKSGSIKLTSFEEMVLNAESLALRAAKELYLPNGIQYFDSEPADHHVTQKHGIHLAGISSAGQRQQDLPPIEELSAYNLVVVDGILMGST